jgi:hypothetical protein
MTRWYLLPVPSSRLNSKTGIIVYYYYVPLLLTVIGVSVGFVNVALYFIPVGTAIISFKLFKPLIVI